MIKIEDGLYYTKDDEWVQVEGDEAVMGISDYAQDALSDIVYLELPEVGDQVETGGNMGAVESVKAAADIYAPVSGEVTVVNSSLQDTPERLNSDPYGSWFVRIRMSDPAEVESLMDAAAYRAYCDERQG